MIPEVNSAVNRNQLKIIACISMLVDHIGYVLFPEVAVLRLIGRIAMPIFAFFIGEGCLYTRNRMKYFLRFFLLGLICQAVYIAESLITKSGSGLYLNILLTFSLSIAVCSAFLYFKENRKSTGRDKIISTAVFAFTVIAVISFEAFCQNSKEIIGTEITIDYGIFGIFLPMYAAISKKRKNKLVSFCTAHILLAYSFYGSGAELVWALIPLVLLLFYNGKAGKMNLKYFFYAFYPCHLAAVYLISLVI